jgi:L-amino acid N-acyltransferase YncA
MLELANWAALHTTANFALTPEPLAPWEALFDATSETYAWLVATEGDVVIGFAKCGPHRARAAHDWTAEITVYLDERSFGRGVGTALYRRLIAITKAQGYRLILAGITTGHQASEALHAKLGFVRCGTFHRVGWKFDAWHDVSYWELVIGEGPPPEIRPVAAVFDSDG